MGTQHLTTVLVKICTKTTSATFQLQNLY